MVTGGAAGAGALTGAVEGGAVETGAVEAGAPTGGLRSATAVVSGSEEDGPLRRTRVAMATPPATRATGTTTTRPMTTSEAAVSEVTSITGRVRRPAQPRHGRSILHQWSPAIPGHPSGGPHRSASAAPVPLNLHPKHRARHPGRRPRRLRLRPRCPRLRPRHQSRHHQLHRWRHRPGRARSPGRPRPHRPWSWDGRPVCRQQSGRAGPSGSRPWTIRPGPW